MDPWHLPALAVSHSVLGIFSRLQPASGSFRGQLECLLHLTMRIRDGEEEKEAENLVGMQIQDTPSFPAHEIHTGLTQV